MLGYKASPRSMPNRNNTTFSSGLINESNNNRRNLLFMKKTLTLLLIVAYVNAFAQLSTNEEPIGYKIIDGGTLSNVDVELKAGASLIILNSGVFRDSIWLSSSCGSHC